MELDSERDLINALADIATGVPRSESLEALEKWRATAPVDTPQTHVENCNGPKTL
jgi:hypothetical protein